MYRLKYSQLDANAIEKGTTGCDKKSWMWEDIVHGCLTVGYFALAPCWGQGDKLNLWYTARLAPAVN